MKGFPGNIHLPQKLFYDLILATIQDIIEWGVRNIVIISGHADPKHAIAIKQACDKIKEDTGVIVFAPMGAIFSKHIHSNLEKEDLLIQDKMQQYPNDFHAGWIETSNMFSIQSDLVNTNYLEQPDIAINDRNMLDSEIVMGKTKGYGHHQLYQVDSLRVKEEDERCTVSDSFQ